ncbi:THAP domain-containing protein 10-like [Corticium candelabrum]|uniref:THAP domain-containing protein 10-like n=1 Tax=Corticium candelabrum TaxID=121492 RepID=UPI002E259BC9|nr:THAP domain-containing protein 10-like [Corticium candelabrum]
MVKRCVAAGCSNSHSDQVSLFSFPQDPVLRKRWTEAVQRTRDKWNWPSRYSVLCSDHFTEDCFETDHLLASSFGIARRARLKPDVVPTHFVRANLRTGASGSSAMSLERTRKRTSTGGESELTSKRGAYEKRQRARLLQEIVSTPKHLWKEKQKWNLLGKTVKTMRVRRVQLMQILVYRQYAYRIFHADPQ